uniref:Cytochrome P450 n=1 Tax=Panagrolaimus sp. ES5 TaxID=591445 RepID=A0AC34FUW7_9BILA
MSEKKDTTANTLSFACLLLAENPKKLQKVFEEIDSLKVVDKLDYDTLSKAVYINAVLMETLRLFPHASMLQSRLTLTDCIIDDEIIIPSGIGILFDTWKIHHDPLYWRSDVNEFQPERHFSSNMLTDYFFPFGIGPRQCIGMRFALMEQKAVLIQFFKHFTVKLPEGITSKDLYISLRNTGTVWPKDLKLIIEKRTHFPNPA